MLPLGFIETTEEHDSSLNEQSFSQKRQTEQSNNLPPNNHQHGTYANPQKTISRYGLSIDNQETKPKLSSETPTASNTDEEGQEFSSPFAHFFHRRQHFRGLSIRNDDEPFQNTKLFYRNRQYTVSTVADDAQHRLRKSDRESEETAIADSLAVTQQDSLVRQPREALLDYDPSSFDSWQTLHTKDELSEGYFQSDKVEDCVDGSCENKPNSRSAKAYQIANTQLENIFSKSGPAVFDNQFNPLIDLKQLDAGALKADRNRNSKMPIKSSSSEGEGKSQEEKHDVRRRRLETREIKGRLSC